MARARNIKPGFFSNEVLAQCEYGARLLFVGLWTLADREGRLEDRPERLRAVLFPFDTPKCVYAVKKKSVQKVGAEWCDIESWMTQLSQRSFITRYEVADCKYIQINNFRKHQHPHVKEPASTIPAPDKSGAKTSDSLLPITDSLLPHTDIPQPGAGTGRARPTVADIGAYCEERGNGIDPNAIFDFYEANGWVQGRGKPIKDWRASVRNWERRQDDFKKSEPSKAGQPCSIEELSDWNPVDGGGA